MMERLQKILSVNGIASRRAAESMIAAGRVTVDGIPATLGKRADVTLQTICVDGKPISPAPPALHYLMLHKPRGYITTVQDERGRPTVMQLLGDVGRGLWPVGRLDFHSEGLLLFTNDGEVTQRLTHPSFAIEKTYQVRVHTTATPIQESARQMESLRKIDGEAIRSARVRVVYESADISVLEVKIREGKKRQVRRMCAACDLRIQRLVRTAEGHLLLGNLPLGKWRYLTADELAYLKNLPSSQSVVFR